MSDQNQNDMISKMVQSFILDRRSRRLTLGTIEYYSRELSYFAGFLKQRDVLAMRDLTADLVRAYLLDLATHRNPGGVHASWRAIKAFLRWYETEEEPENWKNPMRKVAPPKVSSDPLPGISLEDFQKLLNTCDTSLQGLRDRAVFMVLLDTGMRRIELVSLNIQDANLNNGVVTIQHGKGNKSRVVFISLKVIRAIARYLRKRGGVVNGSDPLFITRNGTRFSTKGLEQMLKTRARKAEIDPAPGLHDFRRAFAITCLKNGMDVFTLQRLMGHSSLHVLKVYLRFTEHDLWQSFQANSPVANL